MTRQRLPNRRFNETFEFTHEGRLHSIIQARRSGSRKRGVPVPAAGAGSVIEAMMSDASTAISIALQNGVGQPIWRIPLFAIPTARQHRFSALFSMTW